VKTIAIVALQTDETLLILKIAFLVLLYGFIVLVVRSATKGMDQAPQESIVLGASEAAALRAEHGFKPTRLLVVTSPELAEGATIEVSAPTVVGRDAQSGIRLDHDEYVSSRHARIEPRQEGAWVDDLGSTNGTFVNGSKLKKGRIAKAGDVIKIGATELQVQG
jgi:FHA domain-containing protein